MVPVSLPVDLGRFLTFCCGRNWTKGHPERFDRRLPLRVQGRVVRDDNQSAQDRRGSESLVVRRTHGRREFEWLQR